MSKNYVEFFAGIGLVRLGLQGGDWHCEFSNDIDPKKALAYTLNFAGDDFVMEDIWKLDGQCLSDETLLATASFPCVDLSLAGYRRGLKSERSGTFWAFIEILSDAQSVGRRPPILMIENVEGFVTSNDGNDLRQAVIALNELGYCVDIMSLDAKFFTPQSRPRIFILGVLRDHTKHLGSMVCERDLFENFDFESLTGAENIRSDKVVKFIKRNADLDYVLFRTPSLTVVQDKLADCIEDLPESDPRWWDHEKTEKLKSQMHTRHLDRVLSDLHNEAWSYATIYRRMRSGKSMAELRFDGLAGCLRTPKGGSSKQILLQYGFGQIRARLMTPREYARLQGAPDTFKLPQRDTEAYFGFGDAVCVPVIEWIDSNILSPIIDKISVEESQLNQPAEPRQRENAQMSI